ncbi:/ smpB / SsrA-binding protein /:36885 Forward [Candidatus Hepatoplasma crinochetorum]|uniref:SsrA-binding protein n=1 Tax=Candidatus Hepatoplasma crinochetorum TaxID=295596 RepID=A0A0G7ZNJ5_9MOLU|nr:/ smpB / SsrA-binding protein /:36885 Forward [Candidatus Hepatoplasma crinochetorum]
MKIITKNKRAKRDYILLKTYVAGISLLGGEVKSIRMGKVDLTGSFVSFDRNNNLVVYGINIEQYKYQTQTSFDSLRTRQLLLNKKEIRKINDKIKLERLTIIPTKLFINDNSLIKLEIALAKGRNKKDMREYLKEKDFKKEKKDYY